MDIEVEDKITLESQEVSREIELINTKVTAEDIDDILTTMYKEAQHDKPAINQLFFGMCSAFTKCGMSHDVNSPVSGAGKNYLLKLVSSYFPRKYVEAFFHRRGEMVLKNELTGILKPIQLTIDVLEKEKADCEVKIDSEKDKPQNKRDVVIMKDNRSRIKEIELELKSKRERSQKLIKIGDLIIILLDTPHEGFFAYMMSLISGDTDEDQEYLFTDKQRL